MNNAQRIQARRYRRATALNLLGDNPFRHTVRAYAQNLVVGTAVIAGTKKPSQLTDCDLLVELVQSTDSANDEELTAEELRARLKKLTRSWGRRRRVPPPPLQPVDRNLRTLARLLRLNAVERHVLQFAIAIDYSPDFSELASLFQRLTVEAAAKAVAIAAALPESKVLAALRPRGRLIESGLVDVDDSLENLNSKFWASPPIRELILSPRLDRKTVMDRFLPLAGDPTLDWSDFNHIAEEAAVARDLLRGALREQRKGINILLYGPTGSGKTQLARILAATIGAPLYVAGYEDDEGHADDSCERLTPLHVGNQLVGGTKALLAFDELEDLFEWHPIALSGQRRGSSRMQKLWFNDLLESNAAPTIWISNVIDGIDPAFLRRFAYAIEVPAIGARQRARVLRRHLGSVPMSMADVDAVAERYEASPAQLGSAVATARLATDDRVDRPAIERMLAPVVKLVTGVDAARTRMFDASKYDISVLNSPDDLVGIAEQLADWKPSDRSGVTLCLHGAPGTGKSEYAKYLAHRMGRRIIYRRVSDLQSPFVGVCEKNIAQAFREAEQDDTVLLFDEADSFLRDRRGAEKSWEISQVNEFLQQLENFRGVVACTTNLMETLDQASLRRFVFKVKFNFMEPAQAVALLKKMFPSVEGTSDEDLLARVRKLQPLGIGDFAAVARWVVALGTRVSSDEVLSRLRGEAELRGVARERVGFAVR